MSLVQAWVVLSSPPPSRPPSGLRPDLLHGQASHFESNVVHHQSELCSACRVVYAVKQRDCMLQVGNQSMISHVTRFADIHLMRQADTPSRTNRQGAARTYHTYLSWGYFQRRMAQQREAASAALSSSSSSSADAGLQALRACRLLLTHRGRLSWPTITC